MLHELFHKGAATRWAMTTMNHFAFYVDTDIMFTVNLFVCTFC